MTFIYIIFGVVAAAALCALAYLISPRERTLTLVRAGLAAVLLCEGAWLFYSPFTMHYCPLLDPWGVTALVVIAGGISSWWACRRFHAPRLMAGTMLLLAAVMAGALIALPAPGKSSIQIRWVLAFHILSSLLGYAVLGVGCVAGALVLLRSRALKTAEAASETDNPWPSLTSLDRLFVRSVGAGIALLAAGIVLGAVTFAEEDLSTAWYADPKALLTMASFCFYAFVLYLRKRHGFSTTWVVSLSAIGFALIFLGFLASSLIAGGFHKF